MICKILLVCALWLGSAARALPQDKPGQDSPVIQAKVDNSGTRWQSLSNGLAGTQSVLTVISLVIAVIASRILGQMYQLRDEVRQKYDDHKQAFCRLHHRNLAYIASRITHALALLTEEVDQTDGMYRRSAAYKHRQTAALWFCKNALQDDALFLQTQQQDARNDIVLVALIEEAIQVASLRNKSMIGAFDQEII